AGIVSYINVGSDTATVVGQESVESSSL
ncbi:hypothetical protein EVA_19073, partial [gut metagenome]